jgi:HEPN domain-containing protein
MAVISAVGTGRLSTYGKRLVAKAMYHEGKHFLGAALLLRERGGSEAVVLHLICQGLEITLKGLLLAADYEKFRPRLQRPLGHNLERLVNEVSQAAGLRQQPSVLAELAALNKLYSRHLLRYASGYRLLVDPASIPHRRVLRRFAAAIRLVEGKHLISHPAS